ncbi:MAG: YkgJ family cysteine cluster protein [Gemmatimonadota bacterium]|nr:YkgJ family cysteine cluster protein [Gemmatimonadota bacterium]
MGKPLKVLYNCTKCPAYCCSYAWIPVTDRDLKRLAKHHGVTPSAAERKFTRKTEDGVRVLRHKDDEYFETICIFIDDETRGCSIYSGRPTICRQYPGTGRCGYYDFLSSERNRFDDPDLVVAAYVAED